MSAPPTRRPGPGGSDAAPAAPSGGFFGHLLELRVPANLVFLIVVAAGVFSLLGMPVVEFPNVAFDQIEVTVAFPGASAIEVERLVAKKLEEEIEEVKELDWIRSSSGRDYCRLLIKIEDDASDFDAIYRDVESAVRRVVPELPDGAEEPLVTRIEIEAINPVVQVVLGGSVQEEVLRRSSEELERRLESVAGVRKVQVFGRRDPELFCDLDPVALAAHDLTVPEVARALSARNVNVPSGELRGGGSAVSVRALGEWRTEQELARTAVRTAAEGGLVRLEEVGRVHRGFEDPDFQARFRGRPCVVLAVVKREEGNALDIRDGVGKVLESFRGEGTPSGLELTTIADTTVRIRSRVRTLGQNLGIGAVLVIALLTFAIGFRMSILALWGVGFAFLGAFCVLKLSGQSVNTLSLFGLVLVSGMLVDDAIVVLENIARHRDLGVDLREACIRGAREVAWPVTTSVLTTVAAFLPLLLMTGLTGRFFAVIPIAVTAALLASLFDAVFLLPVHAFEMGLRTGHKRRSQKKPRLAWATGAIRGAVRWTTAHRYLTLLLMAGLGVATLVSARRLRVVFFPSEYQMFFVNVKLPPGTALSETTAVLDRIDQEVRSFPRSDVASSLGTAGFYWDHNYQPHIGATYGQLLVTASEGRGSDRGLQTIMADLRRRLGRVQTGAAKIEVTELNDGPPVGRPVTLRVQAPNLGELQAAARAATAILGRVSGVRDIQSGLEEGKTEVYARTDLARAALRGVSALDVGQALRAANDGLVATRFQDVADDWDVRVRLRPEARRRATDLGRVEVRSRLGARVPLAEVATLGERPTLSTIERFRGERTITITADVDIRQSSSLEANRELQEALEPYAKAHPNVRFLYAGEYEDTNRSFDSLGKAFAIAILCMFMILGTQFRSYIQPFVILGAVPFALTGVVFGLLACGDPLTVPVLLGVVGLAGVAVNDGIVLVSFANDRVRAGTPPLAAAREAAMLRLRPVVLTTITTVAGLLPSATGLGSGGRSVVWGPMAAAFSFGMASATVLTILAMPALFLIAHDVAALPGRLFTRRVRPTTPSGATGLPTIPSSTGEVRDGAPQASASRAGEETEWRREAERVPIT